MGAKSFFFVFSVILSSCFTWHSVGHMLVAEIAKQRLQKFEPETLTWVEEIINPLKYFCGEGDFPMVEGSTWPDRIIRDDWTQMFNWHFLDKVFKEESFKTSKSKYNEGDVINDQENVIWAINSIKKVLETKITERTHFHNNPLLGKSLSMRNLIHFIGDLHQPLHSSTRVSDKLPNGDSGGNLFIIDLYGPDKPKAWNNLHFIWDHMFDLYDQSLNVPITKDQYSMLQLWANELQDEHKYENLKHKLVKNSRPEDWAQESFNLVNSLLYKNIKENQKLPKWYWEMGQRIVKERITLAGYRLADMMHEIRVNLKKKDQESYSKINKKNSKGFSNGREIIF